jgi:hypothetical protein
MLCTRHPQAPVAYKCTHCNEMLCNGCVHVMQIKGGQPLFLCPLCSHRCEPIISAKPQKKKSFIGFLQDTVKLRFRNPIKRNRV